MRAIGGFVLLAKASGAANATTTNNKTTRAVILPDDDWPGTIVVDAGSATRIIRRLELSRGHLEFEGNFLGVEVVAAAVDDPNGIALVEDADEAEAAFAA